MTPPDPSAVVPLGPNHRIRPLDDLQWVLEVRKQPRPGRLERDGGAWKVYAYCPDQGRPGNRPIPLALRRGRA
jgi:hypothetical protein